MLSLVRMFRSRSAQKRSIWSAFGLVLRDVQKTITTQKRLIESTAKPISVALHWKHSQYNHRNSCSLLTTQSLIHSKCATNQSNQLIRRSLHTTVSTMALTTDQRGQENSSDYRIYFNKNMN
ncbi:unnamed protein product [Oppiella nova]|uniref:Uncharacterized protein n=1 Tax=Oppiella nova TaxID=334625 RepID=A0A7R9QXB9_9ACAR|nr:unnamed protein product [Oppiella nova]CAG2177510.1 unnamed protein product [Oppiella nova]